MQQVNGAENVHSVLPRENRVEALPYHSDIADDENSQGHSPTSWCIVHHFLNIVGGSYDRPNRPRLPTRNEFFVKSCNILCAVATVSLARAAGASRSAERRPAF